MLGQLYNIIPSLYYFVSFILYQYLAIGQLYNVIVSLYYLVSYVQY